MKEINKKKGWIKQYRSLQDHWLYKQKPFCKAMAWIDILLSANHNNNRFVLGNEIIELKKGEFITSDRKLMNHWGWSKTKVRAFLKLLQNDSMITTKRDHKKTTVKVVNYSFYQEIETSKKPKKNHKKTSKRPVKDPNKNKEECIKNEEEIKTLNLQYEDLIIFFYKTLPGNLKPNKKNIILSWDDCYRKLIEVDGKTREGLKVLIQYFRNDEFWYQNFESPLKLRRKNKDNIKYVDHFENIMKNKPRKDSIFNKPKGA